MRALRLATRGSALARRQAELVARALAEAAAVEIELLVIETTGDRLRDRPIAAIGGQGAFVKALEQVLVRHEADLAVHSAKDLPSSYGAEGLVIAAVPPRADPRDALVGSSLDGLGPGARVATGAARRRAQLAWLRPDLRFEELRGNIDTRLAKLPPGGAVVVACAALDRLGLREMATEVLPLSAMLPQVGQGALAVQCRHDDEAVLELASGIDDAGSHSCLVAERAFLAELGGGCEMPVGALCEPAADGSWRMQGLVASLDGLVLLRREMCSGDPVALGRALACELRDRCGGAELLAATAGLP